MEEMIDNKCDHPILEIIENKYDCVYKKISFSISLRAKSIYKEIVDNKS